MKREKQVTHDGRIGMVTLGWSIVAKRTRTDQPSGQESRLITAAIPPFILWKRMATEREES